MNKYIIMLASDSHHLMNEPYFYFKGYTVEANNREEVQKYIENLKRNFSLEFKVFLSDVQHLWTCKIK